jgi:hypothetical protein
MRHSTMSRALVLLAASAAALTLVVVMGMPPTKADAAPRTVTKTFSSAQQITIPAGAPATTSGAAAPYPSDVNAGGFRGGRVLDVNVTLKNFSHNWPKDVDVMLSHRGVNRTVMSDVGTTLPVNNITLTLDDETATSLPGSAQLTGGRFRPTNLDGADDFPAPAPVPSAQAPLAGFDGLDPNGVWKLWVVDDGTADVGQFAGGWSIRIKARVGG